MTDDEDRLVGESERNLLLSAKRGNHEDFGKIVLLYQARLRAYASRFVFSSDEVYDLVQDAFIDAFEHMDRFDVDRNFGSWVRTICRNRIFNFYRSQKVRKTVSLSVIDDAIEERLSESNEDDSDSQEKLDALKKCIAGLKANQREMIEFRYQSNMQVKDLAEFYNQTPAALSMTLMRIRDTLRNCVAKRLGRG